MYCVFFSLLISFPYHDDRVRTNEPTNQQHYRKNTNIHHNMLVLFETPAGFALFKMTDGGKSLQSPDDLVEQFASPESANQLYVLRIGGFFF